MVIIAMNHSYWQWFRKIFYQPLKDSLPNLAHLFYDIHIKANSEENRAKLGFDNMEISELVRNILKNQIRDTI